MVRAPPPGPYPAGLLVPQWGLIGASLLVILLRLNLRLRIQRISLMMSDYLMCCAWLCAVATASFDIVFARMGVLDPNIDYFLTQYQGTPEDIEYILQLLWASQFPFYLTFYFAKAALLSIYLRLFPTFMRKRRLVLWAIIVYCALAFAVTMLSTLLICQPIQGNWSLDPDVTCDGSLVVKNFFIGWSLHFAGDVMIFIAPFTVVRHLQMKRALKAGLYCTFLIGVINIAFCLTRFLTLQEGAFTSTPSLSIVELWSALDCNISVLVACLPSLRPYFQRSIWKGYVSSLKTKKFGFSSKSGNQGDNTSGGVLVSKHIAIHLDDPEAAHSFPENSYARANNLHSQGQGGKPVPGKHKSSWEDSPVDDASGRLSAGASDIELVVQTHKMVKE